MILNIWNVHIHILYTNSIITVLDSKKLNFALFPEILLLRKYNQALIVSEIILVAS